MRALGTTVGDGGVSSVSRARLGIIGMSRMRTYTNSRVVTAGHRGLGGQHDSSHNGVLHRDGRLEQDRNYKFGIEGGKECENEWHLDERRGKIDEKDTTDFTMNE